jgi:hypothetical protein
MPRKVRLTRFVSARVEFLSRREMIVDLELRNSYSFALPFGYLDSGSALPQQCRLNCRWVRPAR